MTRVVGDFNADGRADIALVNVPGNETSTTSPVAFSNGDGTFRVTAVQFPGGGFRSWAGTANVRPIVGDFNHDGYADIALTGGVGWFTIPCAMSKGDGWFLVFNTASNLRKFTAKSAQAGSGPDAANGRQLSLTARPTVSGVALETVLRASEEDEDGGQPLAGGTTVIRQAGLTGY